jgi:hypothetical protein
MAWPRNSGLSLLNPGAETCREFGILEAPLPALPALNGYLALDPGPKSELLRPVYPIPDFC